MSETSHVGSSWIKEQESPILLRIVHDLVADMDRLSICQKKTLRARLWRIPTSSSMPRCKRKACIFRTISHPQSCSTQLSSESSSDSSSSTTTSPSRDSSSDSHESFSPSTGSSSSSSTTSGRSTGRPLTLLCGPAISNVALRLFFFFMSSEVGLYTPFN